MKTDVLAPGCAPYDPQAIWHARHAFFDEGKPPLGLVHEAVLRSWRRCSEAGRAVHEPVEFQPVERVGIRHLLDRHADLVDAARPELADLAASVSDAGYAVLMTDVHGNVLAVDGAIAQRSGALRSAFRTGVDLSEGAIGTNAMAVAMREAHAVRVLGAEHFYTETQIFHCSAAPVFGTQGEIVGAVDVSRDLPGMLDSALWLASRCAHRIEKRLFCRQPAQVHVEIDVSGGLERRGAGSGAWLALGAQGEVIAANRAARSLLGLPQGPVRVDFEHLFEERFGSWMGALRRSPDGAQLRLHDGVRLRAVPLVSDGAPSPARPVAVSVNRPRAAAPALGDARLQREFERSVRAMRAGLPILVTGETGTGKEVAARTLHAHSERAMHPFIALNCAAVPGELLAGELFGHVEGAFTGSRRNGALGKIEAANHGTLFLDEIGDMPLPLQAALLRVLDGKEVVRLGCHQARRVDLSIVCATHRDLAKLVEQGQFREDLLFRIAGHTLHLLPLRERSDFDTVLDAVLARFEADAATIPTALRAELRQRPWRGNVRELVFAVQRALALREAGEALTLDDFGIAAQPRAVQSAAPGGWLQRITDEAVQQALQQSAGNVTAAAKLLGMGRATLYRRLQQGRRTPS